MAAPFSCFVGTQSGRPVAGAKVRVIGFGNVDQTAVISGGTSPLITGADGYFRANLSLIQTVGSLQTPGQYVVIVNADGYEPYWGPIEHPGGRIETIIARLSPYAADDLPPVSYNGPGFVSPVYPVEFPVDGVAVDSPWELIEATVTDENGKERIIEAQTVGGTALVNLQARLQLKPNIHLIPDEAYGLTDPDFSGLFKTTFASLTSSGRQLVPGETAVWAANAFPPVDSDTNDLTPFTNATTLAKWLTPWTELPKFRGHYADAMVWLPVPNANGGVYTLSIDYQNINRQAISNEARPLPIDLFAQKKAVRIRIPEAPTPTVHYARLTVEHGGIAQTQPLTVRYLHG